MRIRLSDGTVLETNSTSSIPSKKTVKIKKGTLKKWNSSRAFSACGGRSWDVDAIYQDVAKPLCKVVDSSTKKYTWELGGSMSGPYLGGRGE